MVERSIGAKSNVAIAILLSKRQPHERRFLAHPDRDLDPFKKCSRGFFKKILPRASPCILGRCLDPFTSQKSLRIDVMALGLAVLVVEDEALLTMLLEDLLDELGCKVIATATTLSAGIAEAERDDFDVAIIDVHLKGEPAWPLADRLQEVGKPFVIASGDDRAALLSRYPSTTILSKPYELDSLSQALQAAMNGQSNGA
jgi:CheY-like chemotaxis protein